MKFIIRDTIESDFHTIAEIEEKYIPNPWSENTLKNAFFADGAEFFTAVMDNIICGFIAASCVLDEISVDNIAVEEYCRGYGIATELLKALENKVRDKAAFITLEVREKNTAAVNLYKKFGFEILGTRKNYYSRPTDNALIMTKFYSAEGTDKD